MSSIVLNKMNLKHGCLLLSICFFLQSVIGDVTVGVDGSVYDTPEASQCPDELVSYAVSLTTIPPRIPHLYNVIGSWLKQRSAPPAYIFIFVPKQYKRFKKKGDSGTGESFKCMTERILTGQLESISENATIHRDCPLLAGDTITPVNNNDVCSTIRVIEVEYDWGPATKYFGFIDYRLHWQSKWAARDPPAYWVVSDDDVRYAGNTWSLYKSFIINDAVIAERETEATGATPGPPVGPNTVLTHFSADYRQMLQLEQESFTRPVLHLQGVDTVAFPSRLLQMHENGQCPRAPGGRTLPCTLALDRLRRALRFLHEHCPASFYQDDYVMSLLVNLGNTDVRSTYLVGRQNVARHVDGVSKHYSQMHISDKVGLREEQTKTCLLENVEGLLQHLDRGK